MNHQLQFEVLQAQAKEAGLMLVRLYSGAYLVIQGTTRLAAGLPAAVPLGTLVTFVPGGAPTVSYDDDDGCQIATRSHGSVAWMLLIPAVGLLVLRRRSR